MSKISLKMSSSKTEETEKKMEQPIGPRKPYGFCCSRENLPPPVKQTKPLTKSKQQKALKKAEPVVKKIIESPTLNFKTLFTGLSDDDPKKKHTRGRNLDGGDHRRKNYMRSFQNLKSPRFQMGNSFNGKNVKAVFIPEDLHDETLLQLLEGPMKWYLEDEMMSGINKLWTKKQKMYNEEMDKNTALGKKKMQFLVESQNALYPPWYQDLSIEQLKDLKQLQCVMHKDCAEMITKRTQKTLASIGIVSTFFPLTTEALTILQKNSNCTAIQFLREIYKTLTGNYFEEEGYRKYYDCNQRIILTAIAFLTLPEVIMELNKRLPPVKSPKLYPKPIVPMPPVRIRTSSPYEETLFVRPDWATYLNSLQAWREQRRLTPIPKLILPPKDCIINSFDFVENNVDNGETKGSKLQVISETEQTEKGGQAGQLKQRHTVSLDKKQRRSVSEDRKQKQSESVTTAERIKINVNKSDNIDSSSTAKKRRIVDKDSKKEDDTESVKPEKSEKGDDDDDDNDNEIDTDNQINTDQRVEKYNQQKVAKLDVPPLYGENTLFDFTINGISEKPGPVEYKVCGVLQPPQPNKKSWLDEKHAHYIIAGASDDPPTCPVTYEMTGIANVTPSNSDERFFTVLKLGDGPNKIYPSGRKNLSRHWQEWLQNVDEEFRKVERETNKMIKSIEAVTKLVFPGPTCDSCCSCRQTRKSYLKSKEMKAPYFVIDTIVEDDNKHKFIVGSMAMHSPAPTPPESTVNLLEVIASQDVLTSNVIINGVTNEKGETQYFISGSQKEVIRVPGKIIERPPPRPPRNVPPCVCAIQQMFNKSVTPTYSHDNIPWTKDDGLCFGQKFRPHEGPAYSCKMYPGDKSCRRSPFMQAIAKLKRKAEKEKDDTDSAAREKRMYSIADFQPCGDEHGMSICGGPWGALHTLTPAELAEQERVRKEILKGPPCGTKPGRAVCEGPFGERIPTKPQAKFVEEEAPGEEEEPEEEEEEEEGEKKEEPPPVKEKEKKRDMKCFMSPETIAEKKKVVEKKTKKFIPDPNYPGYDDPWNIFRTAPTEKESETDFKALLKLSSPKKPSTPVQSKLIISSSPEQIPDSNVHEGSKRKGTSKINVENAKKGALGSGQTTSQVTVKKAVSQKVDVGGPTSVATIKSTKQKDIPPTEKKKGTEKSAKSEISIEKSKHSELQRTVSNKSQAADVKSPSKKSQKSKSAMSATGSKRASQNKVGKKSSQSTIGRKSKKELKDISKVNADKSDKSLKKLKKSKEKSGVSVKRKKTSKQSLARKKSMKRDKRKDFNVVQEEDPETIQKNKIQELKHMMKSSNIYPYDVKPVEIPQDPPGICKTMDEDAEAVRDSMQVENIAESQLTSKGPCGWKTKSEQELPMKKTLVYLTDPDYPPETVAVREGGRPCPCRENRAKKKILLYNIGGLIGGKKEDEGGKLLKKKKIEDRKMQVIDGVIYYTPPPSPRRSEEYVPEYDLCASPYDMCFTKRIDDNLKYLQRYSRAKPSGDPVDKESCGCNQYIDTYGVKSTTEDEEKAEVMRELQRTRERLMSEKSPIEQWRLALKDVELGDYFTRCRDSMPCWLKCIKFDKMGCIIPRSKLKTKRPVCECKYERKVLEHREEKAKWKEREKKLKSSKKQPYVNVVDISKPLVPNSKLMISDIKRIPREDEYMDDIKYCITGVAENYSHLPPKQVVGGVQMATPVHTPAPSEQEIPCTCLHRHWSPMDITPGPLPNTKDILLAEKKRRQEAVKEAFRQIYTPEPVYHTHDDHTCAGQCNVDSEMGSQDGLYKMNKESVQDENDTPQHSNKTSIKGSPKDSPHQQTKQHMKASADDTLNISQTKDINLKKPSVSRRFTQKEYQGNKDDSHVVSDFAKSNLDNTDISNKENREGRGYSKRVSLIAIIKTELTKMATEGYIFAKLPKCFLLPQLRYWLMYRRGIALSAADKRNSVRTSIMVWNMQDVATSASKVEPPPLEMTQAQLNKLTFDDATEMKEKISMKKAIFFSQVRKKRVLYGRTMWNTMEYGKFPSTSFKQAYFTYMAGKEADGHVFKPWLRSDVRDMR